MKIEIGNTSADTRVMHDDGTPVSGVERLLVEAGAGEITTCYLKLLFQGPISFDGGHVRFCVGEYEDVVKLVLRDGTVVDLHEGER